MVVGVEQELTQQENKSQGNCFESWYNGLVWTDPYPDYKDLARLAWDAAMNHKQTTNDSTTKPNR